jgi:hypothetical protein
LDRALASLAGVRVVGREPLVEGWQPEGEESPGGGGGGGGAGGGGPKAWRVTLQTEVHGDFGMSAEVYAEVIWPTGGGGPSSLVHLSVRSDDHEEVTLFLAVLQACLSDRLGCEQVHAHETDAEGDHVSGLLDSHRSDQ